MSYEAFVGPQNKFLGSESVFSRLSGHHTTVSGPPITNTMFPWHASTCGAAFQVLSPINWRPVFQWYYKWVKTVSTEQGYGNFGQWNFLGHLVDSIAKILQISPQDLFEEAQTKTLWRQPVNVKGFAYKFSAKRGLYYRIAQLRVMSGCMSVNRFADCVLVRFASKCE